MGGWAGCTGLQAGCMGLHVGCTLLQVVCVGLQAGVAGWGCRAHLEDALRPEELVHRRLDHLGRRHPHDEGARHHAWELQARESSVFI